MPDNIVHYIQNHIFPIFKIKHKHFLQEAIEFELNISILINADSNEKHNQLDSPKMKLKAVENTIK